MMVFQEKKWKIILKEHHLLKSSAVQDTVATMRFYGMEEARKLILEFS